MPRITQILLLELWQTSSLKDLPLPKQLDRGYNTLFKALMRLREGNFQGLSSLYAHTHTYQWQSKRTHSLQKEKSNHQ